MPKPNRHQLPPFEVEALPRNITPTKTPGPYDDLFTIYGIPDDFSEVFTTYVETGQAPLAFLDMVDGNKRFDWHGILDRAVKRRMSDLRKTLRDLKPKLEPRSTGPVRKARKSR